MMRPDVPKAASGLGSVEASGLGSVERQDNNTAYNNKPFSEALAIRPARGATSGAYVLL